MRRLATLTFLASILVSVDFCRAQSGFGDKHHSINVAGLQMDRVDVQVDGRRWSDVDVRDMVTFATTETAPLWIPGLIGGDSRGNLFVFDYGDYMLKYYNIKKGFLSCIGSGYGQGPGEFTSVMGIQTLGDSAVAVLDMTGQKIEVFNYEGTVIRTKRLTDAFTIRFAIDSNGTAYGLTNSANHLFWAESADMHETFPPMRSESIRYVIERDGFLATSGGDLIFKSFGYDAIMRYSPSGQLVFSVETVHQSNPPAREGSSGRSRSLSVSDENIYVQSRHVAANDTLNTVVDVYAVSNGRYRTSFRLPISSRLLVVNGNYFYSLGVDSVTAGWFRHDSDDE